MSSQGFLSSTGRGYPQSEDQLRLIVKVARMYHERGMRQGDIATELHISQPRVSRMLKKAVETGVVQTTVTLPPGVFTDLEDALEERFGLRQAVVVEVEGTQREIARGLGAATADYLAATLIGGDTVGVSSWSASLLAAVDAMRPFRVPVVDSVVQVVGGLGSPKVEILAARLISQFAHNTGADAVFLPAPGVLGSVAAAQSLLSDPSVASVQELWKRLSMILVGIGSVEPSELLRESGNVLADKELAQLEAGGVVGDICLRFFDAQGVPVQSEFNDRVVGINFDDLSRVPVRIGVAGGDRKFDAIRGALLGKWVNVLITDTTTARQLVDNQ